MRGFADNVIPYVQNPLPGQEQLEYPVLTGPMAARYSAVVTPSSGVAAVWESVATVMAYFDMAAATAWPSSITAKA